MKAFVPLFFILGCLVLSCEGDDPAKPKPPEPVVETHFIRDVDYIKNKYFYFSFGPSPMEATIEVYRTVTQQDLVLDPTIQHVSGWVTPDPGDGSAIRALVDALDVGSPPDQSALDQDFQLLQEGDDYYFIFEPVYYSIIGLVLVEPVPDTALKSIGVSYESEASVLVGGTYQSLGGSNPAIPAGTRVLKMLKAPEPRSYGPFAATWPLMLRNFYNLGFTDIDGNSLKVEIEEDNTTRLNPTRPEGSDVKYLRIFGLDRTDHTGTGYPDGKIDLTGLIDLTTGLLQFPVVESFAPPADSVHAWTDGQFAFTGQYQEQYDKSRRIYEDYLNAVDVQVVHQYVIKVSVVTTPAR